MTQHQVYRRFTLVHFAYALVLSIPAALMLLAVDQVVVMVGLVVAEVMAFLVLPHLGWVRKLIDARLHARMRAEASMQRAVLLLRMSDAHRRELFCLEKIAGALREKTDPTASAPENDCFGVERLIELYVRLAIAHRASCRSLEVVGGSHATDDEVRMLSARVSAIAGSNDPAIVKERTWLGRRLQILEMRREARRAALAEQCAIEQDLTMIGETIRWMQEKCAAAGIDGLRTELELALTSARDRDAETLSELSAMRENDIDASVIRLGRDVAMFGGQSPMAPNAIIPHVMHRVAPPAQLRIAVAANQDFESAQSEDVIPMNRWTTAAREAS